MAPENIKKPPLWPLIIQSVAILGSVVVYFASPRSSFFILSAVGYFLTPFFVFASLAVQRAKDLSARNSAFYDQPLGKKYIRIAGALSLASFVIAIPIVIRLATEISQPR